MISKNEFPHEDGNARVADQEEEDHLFVSTFFSIKRSTNSWLIESDFNTPHDSRREFIQGFEADKQFEDSNRIYITFLSKELEP